MPSITPFLWFDNDLVEPVEYYTSIFPDASTGEARRPADGRPLFSAEIELCGQRLMLFNGGPAHAGFTESMSMFVSVETQAEAGCDPSLQPPLQPPGPAQRQPDGPVEPGGRRRPHRWDRPRSTGTGRDESRRAYSRAARLASNDAERRYLARKALPD